MHELRNRGYGAPIELPTWSKLGTETLLSPQDNVKIDDSEHCSRAELLATHVKRLETLHSTS